MPGWPVMGTGRQVPGRVVRPHTSLQVKHCSQMGLIRSCKHQTGNDERRWFTAGRGSVRQEGRPVSARRDAGTVLSPPHEVRSMGGMYGMMWRSRRPQRGNAAEWLRSLSDQAGRLLVNSDTPEQRATRRCLVRVPYRSD